VNEPVAERDDLAPNYSGAIAQRGRELPRRLADISKFRITASWTSRSVMNASRPPAT